MISGGIEFITKFFKFAYLKGIKFFGISYCGINFYDKGHKKTNLAGFIFADSMYKGSFVDLKFFLVRVYEIFINVL